MAVDDGDFILDGVLIVLGVLDVRNHFERCLMEVFGKSFRYGRVK